MTLFSELPFTCRAGLGLWMLLLCLAGVVDAVLSFALRRHRNALLLVPLFPAAYIMWQVTVCYLYIPEGELTSALCIWLGRLPWVAWIAVLVLLTVGLSGILYSSRRYSGKSITPLTIERCADELSCGICYWRDNGHVVFSNDCMNTLCTRLTGRPLMDGKWLREAVTDTIMPVGGQVWQFSFRDIAYGRETLHELIASDVSELYAESEALRVDNEKLAKLNEELKLHGLKIDETVRRQEMLQARVSIHDEMNRLMLSTIAADPENDGELNRIFGLWERNALLLCMESNEHRQENAVKQLEELARALGIQLLWNEVLPDKLSPKHRELFFAAAQEAITNAVKHAQATVVKISLDETQNGFRCTFENDGNIPKNEVCFTGGLANLSILAEEQNAAVSADAGEESFTLSLTFTKNR